MSCAKTHRSVRGRPMRLLALCSLLSFPLSSLAGEWIISPSVAIDQVYTDNALLSSDNEENESVTRVRPGISIYREGGRANLDFNYSPEYRHYWEETRDNETVHLLRANGDVELVENHFFVDAWATADQTRLSSSRSSPDGLTGSTENIDYHTIGLSPYYTTRFGNTSVFEARYSADKVDYDDEGEVDSTSQELDLILGSGTYSVAQAWEISASHTIEDFSGTGTSEDNKISIFRGEFIQQITRRWALAFAAGYEDFELILGDDVEGELWTVGFVFTPGSRTRLALGGGERAFGDDYYLDFEHRSGRTVWTINYKRDYISARDEATSTTLFQRQDAFGNLVRDAVLDNPPPVTVTGVSTLSAEYFESDRVTAAFTFRTQRTRAVLRAGLVKRDYELAGQDTRDVNVTASFFRLISRRFSGVSRLLWTDHQEEMQDYEEWSLSLGVNYLLGTNTTITTNVTHLERDAEIDSGTYDENRVSIGFLTRL